MDAPALDRGLAILETLDRAPAGLNLTEISKAIDSPKNSTSRLVQTLIARGYVVRDEATMLIQLTGKLLRLGQPRVGDVSLVECALAAMRVLRDAVCETVQLGIPIGDEGVVIEQVESTQAVRICVDIGLRFHLHNNAPGKVLLAFLHPKARERTIPRLKLERFTGRTITDKETLRKECERVVKQGYGTDWGEADEGIHCVAAPIFDRPHHLLAVIWVSAVAGRMPKGKFAKVAVEVMKAAREIERRLHA
ncbi:MAG: IclR family transcriptional regulator [Chthoniobacteraceae bacterium]